MSKGPELRVAICGSGNRSRSVWQRHLTEEPGFALVGVQDPQQGSLDKAFELGNLTPERAFSELEAMLDATRPDAVIVCPPHAFHAAAVEAALTRGCHVLVEKPFTTSLDDAVRLTELADAKGLTLAVVQNWRTKSVGRALRRAVSEGMIGDVSHIFFRYVRDRELPHLPDYLFDEPDPMLYALTVHHLDLYRFMLGQEFTRVEGRAFHPRWSRYSHPSVMQLWLETDGGVVVSYAGSISSRNGGHLRWENLVVEGELGTLYNDTDTLDPPLLLSRRGDDEPVDVTADVEVRDMQGQYALADLEILRNFRAAILDGAPLVSPARENLSTVAVVEAVKFALADGRAVDVPQSAAGGTTDGPTDPV
jgi:predicted dehydrogenase